MMLIPDGRPECHSLEAWVCVWRVRSRSRSMSVMHLRNVHGPFRDQFSGPREARISLAYPSKNTIGDWMYRSVLMRTVGHAPVPIRRLLSAQAVQCLTTQASASVTLKCSVCLNIFCIDNCRLIIKGWLKWSERDRLLVQQCVLVFIDGLSKYRR